MLRLFGFILFLSLATFSKGQDTSVVGSWELYDIKWKQKFFDSSYTDPLDTMGMEAYKQEFLKKLKGKKFLDLNADSTFVGYSEGDTGRGKFSVDSKAHMIHFRENVENISDAALTFRFVGSSMVVTYASKEEEDVNNYTEMWLRRL